MMFSKEDFQIHDMQEALEFAPALIFVALVAPFLIAAYTLGFFMDFFGWLRSS